ncbi:transcription factor bHLH95-like [Cynara cardunculus var. scolymus]|uniref:transcription factor bHLH95-like n=1 Tax=Cynara cardunculus var. scolymus TaxID=59895 RepID=UPI000D6241CF|nr:transcription factor bHLH95-like [Cynara cardunculus var. scolymus]
MAKAGVSNDNENHKVAKGKGVMMNGEDDEMDHKKRKLETRVSAERGRRRKMSNLYAHLQTLLPNLPPHHPKVAKATIVKAAMDSIQFLEQTLQNLQKQKVERLQSHVSKDATAVVPFVPSQNQVVNNNDDEPLFVNQQQQGSLNVFETWTSPNVTISMCGTDAHISICSLKKPGLFTTICFILKNHNHDIVSAQICSDDAKTMYMIHVRAALSSDFYIAISVSESEVDEVLATRVLCLLDAIQDTYFCHLDSYVVLYNLECKMDDYMYIA